MRKLRPREEVTCLRWADRYGSVTPSPSSGLSPEQLQGGDCPPVLSGECSFCAQRQTGLPKGKVSALRRRKGQAQLAPGKGPWHGNVHPAGPLEHASHGLKMRDLDSQRGRCSVWEEWHELRLPGRDKQAVKTERSRDRRSGQKHSDTQNSEPESEQPMWGRPRRAVTSRTRNSGTPVL